jgi:hypothetical protein
MAKAKKVFIASSSSAIPFAKKVATYLREEIENSDVREWYDEDVFSPGGNILATLGVQKGECDFAVVLLTKDDFGKKKGEELDLPRDNTIFELGLFSGELGINRCFMVCNAEENALPSDLKGYIRIQVPAKFDIGTDDGAKRALQYVGPQLVQVMKNTPCFDHPRLALVSRDELCVFEKSRLDGGNLLLVPSSTAVVVNSVEPVELADNDFCLTVLKNLKSGAQYEYYYGNFDSNIILTANLVLNIASAEIQRSIPIKDSLDVVKRNLAIMQKNLSIHFRRRPPLQFCVHNALSEENAICYLRCHGDHHDKFVAWATKWEAREIAEELRTSCKEAKKESSIFHSTFDFPLDKASVIDAVRHVFPEDLPEDFYDELDKRCVGALP